MAPLTLQANTGENSQVKCEVDEMGQVSPPQDCCSQVGKTFQEEEKMTKLLQLHHPPGADGGDPPAC